MLEELLTGPIRPVEFFLLGLVVFASLMAVVVNFMDRKRWEAKPSH